MEVPEIDGHKPKPVQTKAEESDDDEIPDMDDFEEDNLEEDPVSNEEPFVNFYLSYFL